MRIHDAVAQVVEVVPHPLPYFTLVLAAPDLYAEIAAGQFVMLETTGGLEPYLRRAFSVADVSNGPDGVRIELLAKIVGRGTRAIRRRLRYYPIRIPDRAAAAELADRLMKWFAGEELR